MRKCVLLSQDEARFPMVPTLVRTLAVKGHRPQIGTRDNKDQVHLFGSLDLVSGQVTHSVLPIEVRHRRRAGTSKTRVLQQAFADHPAQVACAYPVAQHARVVLTIDNAPWHRGAVVDAVLARYPHLELYRLPSYSPQLNVIERLWKLVRHRVTHNRLFDHLAELAQALDRALHALGQEGQRLLSLIMSPRKRAKSSAV